ncbi:AraC family transcriptional regulator [Fictibacillus sp. FJAT-27399]|uniref:AraC family transcriptional regulator n=1 Tax=Fictibacillus sp. FJAT-27399 TaxID=1729689 RepID=UPI000785263C|nr:AraC family transcriptional regulator [Fictibacillus sp. FJAT-27399]
MDYFNSIQNTIDYIEENLEEPLTLPDLARIACFSPFHFHRVFLMLVGHPVMDYIRKRRLAHAADLLVHSELKIVDIAFSCGFSSHESFNRAFKKLFAVTPTQFRKEKLYTFTLPEKAALIKKPIVGGPFMQPKIYMKPEFNVIGYELKTTSEDGKNLKEIPVFWQTYLQNNKMREAIPNKMDPSVELGICTDFNQENGSFSYLICSEVTDSNNVPEGLVARTFPETKYAVFTTPKVAENEFSDSIQATWQYIFKEWFPSSGYEHAGGVEIELYDERSISPESKQMDILVPIK